ncbi:MAG: hypothetical protein AB7I41_22035 [Candidatus Sericytochromatia bacterium]
MSIASPEDLKLIEKLIQRGLVERSTLVQMLESQKKAFESDQKTLSGTLFQLDPQKGLLRMTDLVSKQVLGLHPLSAEVSASEWVPWGSHRILCQEEDGNLLQSDSAIPGEVPGLVLSRDGAWVYTSEGLQAQNLGYAWNSLFSGNLRGKHQAGPWDLFLAYDNSLLALADRGAGTVDVLSTETCELRARFQIRPPGGSSCLSVAFDLKQLKIIVSDNQSTVLYVGTLKDGSLEQAKPGLGLLGNLVMAPDGEHLYVLTLKPAQELLYIALADWSVSKRVALKGDLFRNQSEVPCDLLALSPDFSYLLVMTYHNAPDPFTPIISVIDTAQIKTLRRYALKDGSKPYQLLFARSNPLMAYKQKNLREMLLESGLVDQTALNSLEQSESNLTFDAPQAHPSALQTPQEFVPPPVYIPPVVSRKPLPGAAPPVPPPPIPPVSPPSEAPPPAPITQSRPVETIHLEPESETLIAKILAETFERENHLELGDLPRPWKLLADEAARLRPLLETQLQAEVNIEKLHDGRSLKTTLRRRHLLLRQEQTTWIQSQGTPVVPLQCPQCQQNLMNQWECHVCGFELDNPLRQFKRRIASAEATYGLEHGHVLLPDPHHLRLLEINPRKEIVWNLDPDQLSCEFPRDLIRLPNLNYLVVDTHRNQIYEVGNKGKIHWSMKTFESEQHKLKHPVRIGWRQLPNSDELRYLIVDQGHHRVLEIDLNSQIHWQFGVQGEAGDDKIHLDTPCDLQWTPERTWLICDANNGRVLEVSAEGEIEQCFDRESYGLSRPVCAMRLWNGHTLIVDAEAFQILELDALGVVKERITYYKTGMSTDLRLLEPSRLVRLANQDLFLYNERKAIQILPSQKKLLWFSPLDKIQTQAAPPSAVAAPAPPEPPPPEPAAPVETAKSAPLETASAETTEANASRFRRVSAQERLQALINRPSPVKTQTESFDHSVLYLKEGEELDKLSPYLIDQRHNGIVRIDRKGKVIWHYGYDLEQRLARPQSIQVTTHSLVIADTGNSRILEVSRLDKELLNEIKGPVNSRLNHPRSVRLLANGHYLIADQYNQRLVEIAPDNQIVWEFHQEDLTASPQYVEELPGGDILFVDALLNRVTQINRKGQVRWYYGSTLKGHPRVRQDRLFGPSFATHLANGHTLIADTRHHRVVEVDSLGHTVWEYIGHARSNRLNPTSVRRLDNGHTLISFFNHTKLVELNAEKQCVWSFTLGKDVFQPPVEGDEDTLVQHETEEIRPFYNAVEKRLITSARDSGQDVLELHIELMDNVQMKSVRASLIMMQAEEFGMVFKSFPPPEDLMADRFGRRLVLACSLTQPHKRSDVVERLAGIAEVLSVDPKDIHLPEN